MLTIENLHFSYTGKPPYLIDSVNLHIKYGSYVSIIGENGSAKTTLIKLILGILPPLKGHIHLSTKKIGYVPQLMENFNSQFPITVLELLKCHMKVLKIKDKKLIDVYLNHVGMNDFKNSLIGNLSGGQRQKIFIARAMMGPPELLILDEPSTGIDMLSQKELYTIIKHLNTNSSITVIAVEHNLEAALKNSTHICVMKDSSASIYTLKEYKELLNLK